MPKRQTSRSRKPRAARTSGRARVPANPTSEYQAKTPENFAALRVVRALRGPNTKYRNSTYNTITGNPTPAAPVFILLNGMSAGTQENSRIGRLVKNKWLDIDVEFAVGPNSTMLDASVRFFIVVDTACNGAVFSQNAFFVDATNVYPYSQRDRTNANAQRFCVLYDSKPFALGNPRYGGTAGQFCAGAGQPTVRIFSQHIPLNFSTDYSLANNGNITDIQSNSLYFLAVSDDTTNNVLATGSFTVCFNDDS